MPPKDTARPSIEAKKLAARETIDILHEISTLLNTNLDRNQLSFCVSMIENGVNPEALANVIKELRRESNETQARREMSERQE